MIQRKDEEMKRKWEDCVKEDLTVARLKNNRQKIQEGMNQNYLLTLETHHQRPHLVKKVCKS